MIKWPVLLLLALCFAAHGHFCGVTPEWEAEQLQEYQRTRRLATATELPRSSTQGPFRIHAHYLDMSALPASNITFIQQQVIPSVLKWYKNVLRVNNVVGNWKLSQTTCSSLVTVPADHQDPGLANTDYVIYIYAVNEPTKNYIARGGFCALDSNSLTNPIAGSLGYNAFFYTALTPEQEIMTARHEIAHALAFSPSLWPYFRQPNGNLYSSFSTTVTARDHSVTLLTFPKALARARTAFACNSMQGIELENQGAIGTAGSHWEKRLMANDFMVGTLIVDMLYTDVTMALFEDSGWYTVNYDYTTPTTWGHGKGCDFVNLNCVKSGVTQFAEWCTAMDNNNACSSTHTVKASCNFASYPSALSSFYQYFSSPNDGGSDAFTDYCPYAAPFSDGDCKNRGYAATWYSATGYGEMVCDTCMCFTGSTVKIGRNNNLAMHALCYNVACGETEATVTLGTTNVVCPAAGGQLTDIAGFTGVLNCPPFSELCGTRPCINGCWGSGKCVNGVCQCDDGYSGVDCSIICDSTCKKCSGTGKTQCLACYSEGLLNASAGTCSSCDVTCLTCTGIAANQCSTCVSKASVVLGACKCDNGYTRSADQTTCVSCHSSCSQCSGTLSTQCTACGLNAALAAGQSVSACSCNIGYYMQLDWTCVKCPSTCKACQTANACSVCYPATATINGLGVCACPTSFFLSTDALSCVQCDTSCLSCSASGPTACTSCKPAVATIESGACKCPAAFFLSSDGSQCSGCDSSCTNCSGSGAGQCKSCYPGGVLTPSGGPGSCGCTTGQFYSAPAGCQSCYSACKTCSGSSSTQCTSCYSGPLSQANECQCGSGFFLTISLSCEPCSANCLTCDTSSTHCTSCDTAVSQLANDLCQCTSAAYKGDDGGCKLCDPTCLTCSSASVCLSCRPNATKTGGNCVCNDGFYWGSVKRCEDCEQSCLTCNGPLPSNCLSCLSNASKQNDNTCKCNPGYYMLSDGSCSLCSPQCSTCSTLNACLTCKATAIVQNSKCICPAHQYLSSDGSQCLECDNSCLTCSEAGGNRCISCYNQGVLTPAEGPGVCGCSSGKYYSPPTGCLPCNIGCKDCVGAMANQCLSCNVGAVLAGDTPTSCVCSSGFYLSATGVCQSCNSNCLTCGPSSTLCTSCNTQTSRLDTNTCTCLDGYYKAATGSCLQCDSSCLTCVTGSTQGCLSCYSNANLEAKPGACKCPTGYFPSSSANQCQLCDSSCKECSGAAASLCTACVQNAALSSTGTCQCVSSYYMDATSHLCKSCDPTCRTCSDITASSCQSCYSQAQLSGPSPNSCSCIPGTTPKPTAANCSAGSCDPSCLTCQNTGTAQCLSCHPNAVSQSNASFPAACTCGTGFYPNPNAANCAACDSSCLTCSGRSVFQCLTCPGTKVLVDNLYCASSCPSGQIAQYGVCGSSNSAIFRLKFEEVAQTVVDSVGSLKAIAGSKAASDQNDPVAYYKQGWLFNGLSAYVSFPPNELESKSVILGATHSVEMWIRPAALGNFVCLISKNVVTNQAVSQLFRLCITDSNQLMVSLLTVSLLDSAVKQVKSVVGGSFGSAGVWGSVAYKVAFSSQTGSTVKLIINNTVVQTTVFTQVLYQDTDSSQFLLGAMLSTPSSPSLFFNGNIAEISLYNADFTFSVAPCGCSICTTGGMCLITCQPQQYLTSNSVCQACLSTCSSGCVRGADCSVNVDQLCMSYASFIGCNVCKEQAEKAENGSCQCVANSKLVNGACICTEGYQKSGNLCVQCQSYFISSELKAYFDSSYLTLRVKFARSVASTPLSTSCTGLFPPSTLAKLGQGYSCSWSPDMQTLTVLLGTSATLTNEVLNFNYANIYSPQGKCSYSAVPLVPVAVYPTAPADIYVQLNVPRNFSLICSSAYLELDASGTIGGKGRGLTFLWTLRSDPYLSSLAPYVDYVTTDSVLNVPKALLSDAIITVLLTVRNKFGSQNSTSASVQVTSSSAITLLIEGGNVLQTYASQQKVVRAIPSELCSTLPLQYTWSFLPANSANSGFFAFLTSPSPPNTITIPANTLVPGGIYTFSVLATDGSSSGTASFTVKALKSALIARLNRITSDSSIHVPFSISGEQSYDPDGGQLAYIWTCFDGSNQCLDSSGLLVVNNERNPSLSIPAFKLKSGNKWTISLAISSEDRNASASVLISFQANSTCDLTLGNTLPVRVNGQLDLQIELKASASLPTAFQWTQTHGNTLQFLTPASHAYLVIGSGSMTSGATYAVSMSATNTAGTTNAYMSFTVNYPPSSGIVSLSPLSGVALSTVFTLQASGWEDVEGDYPLTYDVTYVSKGREVALGKASLNSLKRMKLAGGALNLQAVVIDAMAAKTRVAVPTVTVSSTQSLDIIQAFIVDTIDPDQTFPMIIAYSNQYTLGNETFDGILAQLRSYVSQLNTIESIQMEAILSCFEALFSQKSVLFVAYLRNLLEFMDFAIEKSHNSLTSPQIAYLSSIIGTYTGNSTDCLSKLQLFQQKIMSISLSAALPDQAETVLSSPLMSTYSRKISSEVISNLQVSTGNSSVLFPADLLSTLNYPLSTVFDLQVATLARANSSSNQVNVTLRTTGSFVDFAYQRTSNGAEIAVKGLQTPIILSIPMNKYTENDTYDCVYLSNAGDWSTTGVNLTEISANFAYCNTSHLTSFQVRIRPSVPPTPEVPAPAPAYSSTIDCHINFTPIGEVAAILLIGLLSSVILRVMRGRMHLNSSAGVLISEKGVPEDLVPNSAPDRAPPSSPALLPTESVATTSPQTPFFRRWMRSHGVIGLFLNEEKPNLWSKVMRLATVLAVDMCIIGAFYEKNTSEDSESSEEIWGNYSGTDFSYVVISLACGLGVSIILSLLFSLPSFLRNARTVDLVYSNACALCVFLCFAALAGTIYQSSVVCAEAGGRWGISLLPLLGGEGLIVQSILATIRAVGKTPE